MTAKMFIPGAYILPPGVWRYIPSTEAPEKFVDPCPKTTTGGVFGPEFSIEFA